MAQKGLRTPALGRTNISFSREAVPHKVNEVDWGYFRILTGVLLEERNKCTDENQLKLITA
jgi:hypothetical protein